MVKYLLLVLCLFQVGCLGKIRRVISGCPHSEQIIVLWEQPHEKYNVVGTVAATDNDLGSLLGKIQCQAEQVCADAIIVQKQDKTELKSDQNNSLASSTVNVNVNTGISNGESGNNENKIQKDIIGVAIKYIR